MYCTSNPNNREDNMSTTTTTATRYADFLAWVNQQQDAADDSTVSRAADLAFIEPNNVWVVLDQGDALMRAAARSAICSSVLAFARRGCDVATHSQRSRAMAQFLREGLTNSVMSGADTPIQLAARTYIRVVWADFNEYWHADNETRQLCND